MFWIWFLGVLGVLVLIDLGTYKIWPGNKNRSGEIRISDGFNIYAGIHLLGFRFEPDYDDSSYMQLIASTIWHQFFIDLPWWKVPKDLQYGWDSDKYRFGFYLYGENRKIVENVIFLWKDKSKMICMPWSYKCHHTIIEGKDGKRYIEFCGDHKKRSDRAAKYNCRQLPVVNTYDIYNKPDFYWEAPYQYTLKNGEIQRCVGMYHIEEREWRPRCTYWLPIFKYTHRVLSINLTDEIGERSGSWKGGVTGFSQNMLPGEDPHAAYQRIMKDTKHD